MKKHRFISTSVFDCPDCKNSIPLPRIKGRSRKKKHEKTIWCPFCKKEKIMIEYREVDFHKNYYGEIISY